MEQTQQSPELVALETLTKTAEMYLGTLDVVARPAVFQFLQAQINILSILVSKHDAPAEVLPVVDSAE